MVKKIDDPFIHEYKILLAINQRLKNICDFYVLHGGIIYMHSLVDFIEKVGIIHDDSPLSIFNNIAILPNELFDFTKKARKTKITVLETDDAIVLADSELDDCRISIKRIIPYTVISQPNGNEIVDSYIDSKVINTIYKNYDKLQYYKDSKYAHLKDDCVNDLIDSNVVTIVVDGRDYSLTRNLFMALKKTDLMEMTVLSIKDPDNLAKSYVIFREVSEYFDTYTLGAFIVI